MDQRIELNVSFEVEEATLTDLITETSTALAVTCGSYGSFTILAIILVAFLVLAILAILAVMMFAKKKCSRFGLQGESTQTVKQAEESVDAKPKPIKSILKANKPNDIQSSAHQSQTVKPKDDKNKGSVSNVASRFKPTHICQLPRSFILPGLNSEPLGGDAQPMAEAEVNQQNNEPIPSAARDEQFEVRVALNVRNNAQYCREEALVGLVIDRMIDRLDDQLHAIQDTPPRANGRRGGPTPADHHS